MKQRIKPELLAPAGSLEGFHAALAAGADAVYAGLKECNARLRAQNFSLQTFAALVPFAHAQKKKVYATLNTLVKQQELSGVFTLLCQLEDIGVDSVIVQDLGIAQCIRERFPRLALHASTQMAIHNSAGVRAAEQLGFKRVILSRECTLAEITSIRRTSQLELEVFVHGALCYSISGLCLASSILGGNSGNRGRCTQVCRRGYTAGATNGYLFSPRDLCALEFLPALTDLGIASFKIEGRMKNAEYVSFVVGAYRKAIDNPEAIPALLETLNNDFGREKTSFFFPGTRQSGIVASKNPPGIGQVIGTVAAVSPGTIEVESENPLLSGDRIRLNMPDRSDGATATIISVEKNNDRYRCRLSPPGVETHSGDIVYRTGGKTTNKKWAVNSPKIKPSAYRKQYSKTASLIKQYMPRAPHARHHAADRLYLALDSVPWLTTVQNTSCDGIIFRCTRDSIEHLGTTMPQYKNCVRKLTCALPPFISDHDLHFWEKNIKRLHDSGVRQWMCTHWGERLIIPPGSQVYADTSIWCINSATQYFLQKNGFSCFSYSLEDDILNLKPLANSSGFMVLFAHVPFFISRVMPALQEDTPCTDMSGNGFRLQKRDDFYYVIGEKPLCLTHRRDKLHAAGITRFVLDFSLCPAQHKTLATVLQHYADKKRVPGSITGNHKAGLH